MFAGGWCAFVLEGLPYRTGLYQRSLDGIDLLEAAIGIEPMNKGFADSAKLYAQVTSCSLVGIFIGSFVIWSLLAFTQIWRCFNW
jgi:hypothetical protein